MTENPPQFKVGDPVAWLYSYKSRTGTVVLIIPPEQTVQETLDKQPGLQKELADLYSGIGGLARRSKARRNRESYLIAVKDRFDRLKKPEIYHPPEGLLEVPNPEIHGK